MSIFLASNNVWLFVAAILPIAVAVTLIFTRRMWMEIKKEQKRIDRQNQGGTSPSPATATATPGAAKAAHPVWGQAPQGAEADPFAGSWDDDEPTVMFEEVEEEEEVYEEGGMSLADAMAADAGGHLDQSENSATALEALTMEEDDEEEEQAPHPAANPAVAFNGHNAGMPAQMAPQQYAQLQEFIVKGVSVATTQDVQITVMAVNEQHAKQLADQQNIYVQHIVPAPKIDVAASQDQANPFAKPADNKNVPPIVNPQESTSDWNPWDS